MSSSPKPGKPYQRLDAYERKVLDGWEEIYKRGLLTMWVLLAVRDQARYAAEIAGFVADHTRGTVTVDDRSLYRALRRLARLELIAETPGPGARTGADRKYHRLTATGARVLDAFIDRHVRPIYLEGNAHLFTAGSTST